MAVFIGQLLVTMKRSTNSSSTKGLYERLNSSIAGRLGTAATVAMVLIVVGSVAMGTVASVNAQQGTQSGNNTSGNGGAAEQFAVTQGNNCYTVSPLGNDTDNVVSFYNYRGEGSGYSSRGTTDLQVEDTSQMFLYKGNGGLSLVFLHDRFTGNASSGGGAVTLEMHGLPVTGGWTVKDDGYAGSNDTFTFNESVATASWSWAGGRSDGGVYQANPNAWNSEVKIVPRFNRESASYPDPEWEGDETSNQVQRWIVRSGDGEAHALNLYEPVMIQKGTCGQTGNQMTDSGAGGSNGDGQMDTSTEMGTTSTDSGGSSNQTEATGPGFGIGLTVFALAAALIAILRRR